MKPYNVMYLCGWFVFTTLQALKAGQQIDMPSRESAKALAAMYNRIYTEG